MQWNTSKASAEIQRPQIKAIKTWGGPDSAEGIPLNFLRVMMMKDNMRSSKY